MIRNEHMKSFMEQFPHEGLTYDDVTLATQYADFLPHEVDLNTRLTTRITLHIPFVSAAMDTVTESEMAIQMALLGGIGIIHKNLPIKDQAKQVARVKHHLNGLIIDPIAFRAADTLETVQKVKDEKKFSFSGFPIVDEDNHVVGILTATDIRFCRRRNAKVTDVMTTEVITAPQGTTLQKAYDLMMKHKIGKLPLVNKDGHLVALYSFTDVQNLVEDVQPMYNRDAKYRLRAGAAVSANDHERAQALAQEGVDVVVVDSAHGHSKGILEMVKWLKKNLPDVDVIAGNICTAEAAVALRDAGADGIKVGVGPGSICTTRVVCGVGVPQLTAVYEATRAVHGSVPVIADGGVRLSGDVPKALAVGADSVMLGSVMAGTSESPGEKIIHQGRQYVVYRGMGSLAAMKSSLGSRERYAQTTVSEDDLVPQGIEGIVPYAGTVQQVMTQYCGGLGSALGYCGCRTIPELQKRARFVRVTAAGMTEAHPHDVKIIKDAPNYKS